MITRHQWWLGCVALCVAAPLAAQDRTPPMRPQMIEQAFAQRMQQQLGLDQATADKVRAVLTEWGGQRRELETEERQLHRALERQLRPGVAANADSVSRAIDQLLQNRVAYAETFQAEMRELAPVLSPVQRAQFLMMRDQILRRIRELQEARPLPGNPPQTRRNRP